jgi:hypothetical protein
MHTMLCATGHGLTLLLDTASEGQASYKASQRTMSKRDLFTIRPLYDPRAQKLYIE